VKGVDETHDRGHGGLAAGSADKSGRHRADTTIATMTAVWPVDADELDGQSGRGDSSGHHAHGDRTAPLFTKAALDYAAQRHGQSLVLLQAGCTTADGDPDLGRLRACGHEVSVSLLDDDQAAARAAVAAQPELDACTLCDPRMAPLVPRSFDIVHCALLLQRISHAELVLDRLVETLKPGGLLLLQTGDRDCAAGFLDRMLPRPVRRLIWRSHRPGAPGPYPAVYERLASGRGIQSYVTRRGLVIAQRQELNLLAGRRRPLGLRLATRLVARLSRGRLTAAHDELRYIIRKPENGFARVL
jgi:SAM-dependent methyltransferase